MNNIVIIEVDKEIVNLAALQLFINHGTKDMTEIRQTLARELETKIMSELSNLGMKNTRFKIITY